MDDRALADESLVSEWLAYGGTHYEQRYSPLEAPEFVLDHALAEKGMAIYYKCDACHGPGVYSGGMAPDLRASALPLDQTAFEQVVRGGSKIDKGMPAFRELSDEDLIALRHYIRQQASHKKVE